MLHACATTAPGKCLSLGQIQFATGRLSLEQAASGPTTCARTLLNHARPNVLICRYESMSDGPVPRQAPASKSNDHSAPTRLASSGGGGGGRPNRAQSNWKLAQQLQRQERIKKGSNWDAAAPELVQKMADRARTVALIAESTDPGWDSKRGRACIRRACMRGPGPIVLLLLLLGAAAGLVVHFVTSTDLKINLSLSSFAIPTHDASLLR